MTMSRTIAALTLSVAFGAFGSVGCGGGVEGNYKLDKAEMKKTMEAEVAKLPADQQGFAKLAVAMIDAMDMTLAIESGGKLKMTATKPSLEEGKPAKTDEKEGSWKMEGESVVLTMDGKPVKCAKAGTKLNCESDKKGQPGLVFLKS